MHQQQGLRERGVKPPDHHAMQTKKQQGEGILLARQVGHAVSALTGDKNVSNLSCMMKY